jgi:hypothetical protein
MIYFYHNYQIQNKIELVYLIYIKYEKMLPSHALSLIREFSKPLTSPHWRCGAPHAILITESPMMQNINQAVEDVLRKVIHKHYNNDPHVLTFAERWLPGIFHLDTDNYIHEYGESLFQYVNCINRKVYEYTNFYCYAKQFLKPTNKLELIHYEADGRRIRGYLWADKKDLLRKDIQWVQFKLC